MGFNDRRYPTPPPRAQMQFSFGPKPGKDSFTFKLLIVNIAIFFIDQLFLKNPQTHIGILEYYGRFSAQSAILDFQIWRFITFQFIHANFSHLLFNMISLYMFGTMVEAYFGSKRFLAYYLLSGAAGAVAYLVLWQAGFFGAALDTPLVGASAGIYAVLIAGARIAPHTKVLMMMIFPVTLRTLAWGLVAFNTFNVLTAGANAGGQAGHLGGVALGFFLLQYPHWLDFADKIGAHGPSGRGSKAKKNTITKIQKEVQKRKQQQTKVNEILDKVKARGLHSLTEKEKKILQKETHRQKNAS